MMVELGFWALVAVCLYIVLSVAMLLHYPLFRPLALKFAPSRASSFILLYALSPFCITFLMILLKPAPWGYLMTFDHYHGIRASHSLTADYSLAVVGVLFLLLSVVLIGWHVKNAIGRTRVTEQMFRLADESGDPGERVPLLAANVGFIHPRIYISSVLKNELSDICFLAVQAHERAHSRRKDNLRLLLVVMVCGGKHILSYRLLGDLRQTTELACDDFAACEVGTVAVAEALVTTARLKRKLVNNTDGAASGIYPIEGQDLKARIHRLLAPQQQGWRVIWFYPLALSTLSAVVLALSHPLHCVLEFFFL